MEEIVKKNTEEVKDDKIVQLVTFVLASERYGIDIMKTREIMKMVSVTPIPNSIDFVEGVINLRGSVIPIIDLKKRFNLYNSEEKCTGMIILRLDDMEIGIMIDKVAKVISILASRILPPPPVVAGIGREYINGVAREDDESLLIVLDINKILSYEEVELMKENISI
jgi:purine-binding chemotaxis protein CheW